MNHVDHLRDAKEYLQSAMSEPAHSPTEDALIDCLCNLIAAFETVLDGTR